MEKNTIDFQALAEGHKTIRQAQGAQREQLRHDLAQLASFYVRLSLEDDRKLGMEAMCDDFFKHVAQLYPGGWTGLLRYAMKQAG